MDAPVQFYERGGDIGGTWTVRNFVPCVNCPHANSNPNGLIGYTSGTHSFTLSQARLAAYFPFYGCGTDVLTHFYTFSTDPKLGWNHSHATRPEILEHLRGVTDRHSLRSHCLFYTPGDKAGWKADANVWRIETRDVRTGEKHLSCATSPRVCNRRAVCRVSLTGPTRDGDIQGRGVSFGTLEARRRSLREACRRAR